MDGQTDGRMAFPQLRFKCGSSYSFSTQNARLLEGVWNVRQLSSEKGPVCVLMALGGLQTVAGQSCSLR